MNRTSTLVFLVVLVVILFAGYQWRYAFLDKGAGPGQLVAHAHYQCDKGATIDADYYQGAAAPAVQPGQPPVPTGYVRVALSDGRSMTLAQTISADGARYATKDESFVFWSKGDGVLVLEGGKEKSYMGCIKVVDDPGLPLGSLPQVYESGARGISLRYPAGYTADESYAYQGLGSGKDISGVKFTIDASVASGTNLAADSYVSVEQLASTATSTGSGQATSCTADKFFYAPNAQIMTLSDGINTYSYASTTDAAVGNRYEEQIFAIPGTHPCLAVRYFIHYGAIENYPPGAVQPFDRQALVDQFDAIRRTLVINQ
jgi:membrane-bound inhibitor of C-type lysozyme